ncbi:glycosyltransferase [Mesorhizobium sp. CO1-1-7]|uniref:glycosyltransferase n=1 Tax=unclassified Mesorhizobium TaxID=325217 RepID=UPI001CCC19B2|nr:MULTISPECIES: glycosyltransferase [unclassified Mesorhizobium]MBZ9680801.1 glycosyltransferase [Mesorhizobium sp. CO1-1-2]MBZ9744122.1 glycosyltransferase [Mesorhizobium sp. CO1-1-7]MBZ9924279.1 glycosyltransferase [Mesorhizobium sp. BR1-1-4]
MDKDGHETFEEMVGPIDSALERFWLNAARQAGQSVGNLKQLAANRLPFILPTTGPFSGLDGSIRVAVHVLSHDPLVIYTPIGGARPLSSIVAIARRFASRRASFLMMPNWTLERPRLIPKLARDLAWHRERFPAHELIFLCNTEEERRLVTTVGGTAIFSNHNLMVSEDIFRPLPDVPVEFDAVYNARISHTKRHHLAFDIERLAHITFSIGELPRVGNRAFIRRLQAQSPLHRIANPIIDGLTGWLPPQEINRVYNQAAVGLCLSAAEGAMRSSMEYLMAGLPVVSTPSLGGRDVFFDPDYCIIAEPDPAALRRAVETLRDRAIPRDEIRNRTLAKVRAQRQELTVFLSDLLKRMGSSQPPLTQWPFPEIGLLRRWAAVRRHANEITALRRRPNGF